MLLLPCWLWQLPGWRRLRASPSASTKMQCRSSRTCVCPLLRRIGRPRLTTARNMGNRQLARGIAAGASMLYLDIVGCSADLDAQSIMKRNTLCSATRTLQTNRSSPSSRSASTAVWKPARLGTGTTRQQMAIAPPFLSFPYGATSQRLQLVELLGTAT